jgi:hypothetical protein
MNGKKKEERLKDFIDFFEFEEYKLEMLKEIENPTLENLREMASAEEYMETHKSEKDDLEYYIRKNQDKYDIILEFDIDRYDHLKKMRDDGELFFMNENEIWSDAFDDAEDFENSLTEELKVCGDMKITKELRADLSSGILSVSLHWGDMTFDYTDYISEIEEDLLFSINEKLIDDIKLEIDSSAPSGHVSNLYNEVSEIDLNDYEVSFYETNVREYISNLIKNILSERR